MIHFCLIIGKKAVPLHPIAFAKDVLNVRRLFLCPMSFFIDFECKYKKKMWDSNDISYKKI